jgi:hypothetical protein
MLTAGANFGGGGTGKDGGGIVSEGESRRQHQPSLSIPCSTVSYKAGQQEMQLRTC